MNMPVFMNKLWICRCSQIYSSLLWMWIWIHSYSCLWIRAYSQIIYEFYSYSHSWIRICTTLDTLTASLGRLKIEFWATFAMTLFVLGRSVPELKTRVTFSRDVKFPGYNFRPKMKIWKTFAQREVEREVARPKNLPWPTQGVTARQVGN